MGFTSIKRRKLDVGASGVRQTDSGVQAGSCPAGSSAEDPEDEEEEEEADSTRAAAASPCATV